MPGLTSARTVVLDDRDNGGTFRVSVGTMVRVRLEHRSRIRYSEPYVTRDSGVLTRVSGTEKSGDGFAIFRVAADGEEGVVSIFPCHGTRCMAAIAWCADFVAS